MVRLPVALGVLAGFLLSGCGRSTQFDSYSTALQQTRAAVDAHRASAGTATEQVACAAERTHYADAMRSPLSNMEMMSSGGMMQGGMMQGDGCPMCQDTSLADGCAQMQTELDAHLNVGCLADSAANAAEIIRHCDQMDALLDAEQQRLQQMMGGGMMGSP